MLPDKFNFHSYLLFTIILLSFALRACSLNQSLWLDEATSGIVARDLGFIQIINEFARGDFHPPLYYLDLWMWAKVLGTSEISLRLPSVFYGIGTIIVTYLIARGIFKDKNKKYALLPPLLLAIAPLHIYYSQEARMYSLGIFLVSLTVLVFTKILHEEGRVEKYWLFFSLLLPLIFLTDYLPMLILPVFWIAGFLHKKNSSWWKKFVTSHIILLLVFVLWLPVFSTQLGNGLAVKSNAPHWWQVLGKTNLKEVALIPVKFMLGRISFEDRFTYTVVAVVGGMIFGGILLKSAVKVRENLLIWLWLVLPVLLAIILGVKLSVLSYFRLTFILPAFYLLLAIGIVQLKDKFKHVAFGLVFIISLVSSLIYLTNPKFHREDWRGLVTFIESNRSEGSLVLFVANSQMEGYKYYKKDAKVYGPDAFDATHSEVWLINYVKDIFDPEEVLRGSIESSGYALAGEYEFQGIGVVQKYDKIY